MKFRTRLFLGILGVLLVGLVVLVWLAQVELRAQLEEQYRDELSRTAALAAAALHDRALTDALADSLGAASGLRVSFISPDGAVIGDSEIDEAALQRVDSHRDRPEVGAALGGKTGVATRASETVSRRLLYVAVPHPAGVVRVARPIDDVRSAVTRSRRLLLAGSGLALLTAAALSLLLVRYLPRPFGQVRETARAIAGGDLSRRVRARGSDDVANLGRAVDEMAEQLERTVIDLSREKSDLTALFDGLEDGVAVVDGASVVVRANRAFERWAGRTGLKGVRFGTLFRDPRIGETVSMATEGKAGSYEITAGGRTLLMSAQPYGGGAVVLMRDLTQLRQLEGVRRDFVANVSHELKTPLTGILGFAEPLAEGDLPPDQTRLFAQRIEANARRMRDLLNDLLDLARVESGHWEPAREAVRLDQIARSAWSDLEPIPGDRGVLLKVDESARVAVDADPGSLHQMLHNLFDNALRYSPAGSEIEVHALPVDGNTLVEIRDQGPGIARQHRERVFERFYRVNAARDRDSGGTGLGLSIVKHLVVAHGGNVGVRSELGEGATFWFTLPASSA